MKSMLGKALDRLRERRQSSPKPSPRLPVIDTIRLVKAVRKAIATRHTIPMKNWKTTIFGTGGLLMIWAPVLAAFFDGDPATVPQFGTAISASLPAIGLLFAKDFNVSGKA